MTRATGIETPRIQVTLATEHPGGALPPDQPGLCRLPDDRPAAWAGREAEGLLLVPHAGEMLYRSDLLDTGHEADWIAAAKAAEAGA